jgi:hypothetical protein
MNDTLDTIFKNINEWLRFAEAKHSGLLVIGIGLLFIIGRILRQPKSIIWRLLFIMPAILIGVSIFISLSSFSPTLKSANRATYTSATDNVYFFGSVAHMDTARFKSLIKEDSVYHFNRVENQLIDQIIVNSRITTSKMNAFKKSLFFFKLALLILIALYLVRYVTENVEEKMLHS